MRSTITAQAVLLLASLSSCPVSALTTSPPATRVDGGYYVQDVDMFTDYFFVDFTKGTTLHPSFIKSTDTIGPDSAQAYSRTH